MLECTSNDRIRSGAHANAARRNRVIAPAAFGRGCAGNAGEASTLSRCHPDAALSVTITHRAPATHRASMCKLSKVRHALFVAFHYPPEASSSGVLRTLKYSRYLPEYGWRVSVVAPDPSAYSVCDPQLEEQIPPGTKVVRTRYLNTKRDLS